MEKNEERFGKIFLISASILLFIALICFVVSSIFDPQSMIATYLNIDNQVRNTVITTVANISLIVFGLEILVVITYLVGEIYFAIKKHKTKT